MTDIEASEEEKVIDKLDEKLTEPVKPHHTINQDLDIGTPVYKRYIWAKAYVAYSLKACI